MAAHLLSLEQYHYGIFTNLRENLFQVHFVSRIFFLSQVFGIL